MADNKTTPDECRPLPIYDDVKWHWVQHLSKSEPDVWRWCPGNKAKSRNGIWELLRHRDRSPAKAHYLGWRYIGPCKPPDAPAYTANVHAGYSAGLQGEPLQHDIGSGWAFGWRHGTNERRNTLEREGL